MDSGFQDVDLLEGVLRFFLYKGSIWRDGNNETRLMMPYPTSFLLIEFFLQKYRLKGIGELSNPSIVIGIFLKNRQGRQMSKVKSGLIDYAEHADVESQGKKEEVQIIISRNTNYFS